MFSVDGYSITLSRGDTAAFRINISFNGDYTPEATDRVLFTIKDGSGQIVKQKIYALDENNGFNVYLYNDDTDDLSVASYRWDIRYVIHPYYDPSGKIADGDQVITPELPMGITLLSVVGDI